MIRLAVLAGLLFITTADARARGSGQRNPPDFTQVTSSVGVALYQKDYPGGNPDFVQVIDLEQGASLRLLHGPVADLGAGQGGYGGDNPRFTRQALDEVWNTFSSSNPSAFCLTNGQFFSTNDNPTPLAFPIKVNGIALSDGYGINEFDDQKMMLELWDNRADIKPFSPQAMNSSNAANILVGLAEDADKGPANLAGRTFVGVADVDHDGSYETVLVFTSKTATQPAAAEALRSFGAGKVMMLDGGDSSQLTCQGNVYVTAARLLPQTIAVLSGDLQPFAADIVSQPNYPVLVTGERLEVLVELRNVGSETWPGSRYGLINTSNPWGQPDVLPGLRDVLPGQSVIFSWRAEAFSNWGVFVSEWRLEVEGQTLTGGTVTITAVVVPEEMAEKKAELEQQVAEWAVSQSANVEQLITQWIQEQLTDSVSSVFDQICSGTGLLLPLGAAVWLGSRRKRGWETDEND